jgi:hypothetical protein
MHQSNERFFEHGSGKGSFSDMLAPFLFVKFLMQSVVCEISVIVSTFVVPYRVQNGNFVAGAQNIFHELLAS